MNNPYIQTLMEKGYRQEWETHPEILVRLNNQECYVIMTFLSMPPQEAIRQRRMEINAHYRGAGYSHVYQLCIVFGETAIFPDAWVQMTTQIPNLWLFAMDQNRMFQYENQPLEFDGVCAALESLPVMRKKNSVFQGFDKKTVPWLTLGIIACNLLLYVVPVLLGCYNEVIEWGMNQSDYVLHYGQIYRLITAMFLHGSVSHLINNMVVLMVLGLYLEPVLTRMQYGLIYFCSGIAGNLCSLFFHMGEGGSIGASGAIFGLSGALLSLVLFYKGKIPGISVRQVIYMCVVSLYSGFVTVNVDNAAHVGGLIFGFLLVIFTNIFHKKQT